MMMSKKNQARERAKKVLSELGMTSIPVDVDVIAERLGVRISIQPLDEDTSGVIVMKNGQAVIGVNQYHHPNRQRFTIAHELGHFELHKHEESVFVDTPRIMYRDRSAADGINSQEIEANAFAAELLMPENAIKAYIARYGLDYYDDVFMRQFASTFMVSEQALTNRLVTLGYELY